MENKKYLFIAGFFLVVGAVSILISIFSRMESTIPLQISLVSTMIANTILLFRNKKK